MFMLILVAALLATLFIRERSRPLLIATLLGATLLLVPSVASAQSIDGLSDAGSLGSITVSALTVQVLISVLIPVLTGLATKASLSSSVKGLITLVLNVFNAAIVQATVADGGAVFSRETIIMTVMGLAISVAMYAGVYGPANVTSSTSDGKLFPNAGLG